MCSTECLLTDALNVWVNILLQSGKFVSPWKVDFFSALVLRRADENSLHVSKPTTIRGPRKSGLAITNFTSYCSSRIITNEKPNWHNARRIFPLINLPSHANWKGTHYRILRVTCCATMINLFPPFFPLFAERRSSAHRSSLCWLNLTIRMYVMARPWLWASPALEPDFVKPSHFWNRWRNSIPSISFVRVL